MARRKTNSPVSLFSFQDIIMSVVGIVILITLILLLQLVSQMSAAPPAPTITVQEIQQQIDSLQPTLKEMQESIAVLHQARAESEILTPSQDQIDALQSTIDVLETNIADTEKKSEETENRIDELQNDPAMIDLAATEQEVQVLTEKLANLKQQSQEVDDTAAELQAKIQELKAKSTALDKKIADAAVQQLKVTVPQDSQKTAFILVYGQGTINVIPTDGSSTQTFTSRSQFDHWTRARNSQTEHFVVYVRPSRFGQYEDVVKNLRARGFDVGLQVIGENTNLSFNN